MDFQPGDKVLIKTYLHRDLKPGAIWKRFVALQIISGTSNNGNNKGVDYSGKVWHFNSIINRNDIIKVIKKEI